jgi:hypothetical protein
MAANIHMCSGAKQHEDDSGTELMPSSAAAVTCRHADELAANLGQHKYTLQTELKAELKAGCGLECCGLVFPDTKT